MGELGQAPRPAEHGSFIQQSSLAGRKVDFVQTSNSLAGRIILQASGNASLQDFGYFHVGMTYLEDENTYHWDNIIAWNYCNFYIDGADPNLLNDLDKYRVGSTATSTRGKQSINIFSLNEVVPDYPTYSHVIRYFCQNNDSSSHTIDGYSVWKYIITGDKPL